MVSNDIIENKVKIINIGIFGSTNSGKCSLVKQLTIEYGNIANPYDFKFNNILFHSFPIPCTQPDYQENYDMSIENCDIVILMTDPYEEGELNKELYDKLIRDAYLNDISKIIVCFNKCDLSKPNKSNEIKTIISDNDHQMKLFYSKSNIDIVYIDISVKEGIGIDQLISNLCDEPKVNSNNTDTIIKEDNNIIMKVHDSYEDNEDSKMVISGKVLQGTKINIDTPLITSLIKPIKICNCFGDYVDCVSKNEFITLKFDLKQFKNKIQGFNKSLLITSPQLKLPKFKLLESLLIFTSIPCSIISQGFKAMFQSGSIMQECSIEKIAKEIPNQHQTKGKGFIVPELNAIFKAMINLTEDINRDKYENNKRLGAFTLLYEGKVFSCGKVIKYKPSI